MKGPIRIFRAIRVGLVVLDSFDEVKAGLEEAKAPDSPGGVKVTPGEALGAIFGGLIENAGGLFEACTGDKLPADVNVGAALLEAAKTAVN